MAAALSAAERQNNCRSCNGLGFINEAEGGNPRDFPRFTEAMIFCQCVKPTVHNYTHGPAYGNTRLTEQRTKAGIRLPSDKRAETRSHNAAVKARQQEAERVQNRGTSRGR